MAIEGQFDKERSGQVEASKAPPEGQEQPAEQTSGETEGGEPEAPEKVMEKLKGQLDEERRLRQAAETGRVQAEQQRQQLMEAVQRGELSTRQANMVAIDRALEATQGTIDALKGAYAAAAREGEYEKMADLQAQMSEMAARKQQLEYGKHQLSQEPEQPQHQQPVQNMDPFEAALQRYSPRTQAWFRQHPEAIQDPAKANLALAAHYKAVGEGYVADTDAYFDKIETEMGYKGAGAAPQPKARLNTSAPVSRTGGRNGSSKVASVDAMTPAMLDAARTSGLKPEDWLKHYNELVSSGEMQPFH